MCHLQELKSCKDVYNIIILFQRENDFLVRHVTCGDHAGFCGPYTWRFAHLREGV